MKRSEMIDRISKTIRNSDRQALSWETDIRNLAEKVLNTVEESGMKPPVNKRDPILLREERVWEKE